MMSVVVKNSRANFIAHHIYRCVVHGMHPTWLEYATLPSRTDPIDFALILIFRLGASVAAWGVPAYAACSPCFVFGGGT
jgi:hypothetical protein